MRAQPDGCRAASCKHKSGTAHERAASGIHFAWPPSRFRARNVALPCHNWLSRMNAKSNNRPQQRTLHHGYH